MQVLIIGIGDAFTKRYYGTSALIKGPGGYVLLDTPDTVHRAVHDAIVRAKWGVEAADVDDIILTHLHGDHVNGLESLGFARLVRRFKNKSTPLPRVHTGGKIADRLWERLAPAMDGPIFDSRPSRLDDFFVLSVMEADKPETVAGLTVRCHYTRHPIPTIGMLISDGKTTLGWSGDTPFDREYINWLSQADVIIHEANLGPLHTPIGTLNDLPADLRKKILLIHVPDNFDPKSTDMVTLHEGQLLEL